MEQQESTITTLPINNTDTRIKSRFMIRELEKLSNQQFHSFQLMHKKSQLELYIFSCVAKSEELEREEVLRVVGDSTDLIPYEIESTELTKSLSENDNIVEIINYYCDDKLLEEYNRYYLYIEMPLYKYGDLNDLVKNVRNGAQKINEQQLFSIIFQMLRVLTLLHSKRHQIYHRDFSLHNVFIEDISEDFIKIRVADFEQSIRMKEGSTHLSLCTSLFGKDITNPPEVYKRNEATYCGRSGDIWSLGVVMYQLVTLDTEFVFRELSQEEIYNHLYKNSKYKQELEDSNLQEFIWQCLQIDYSKRPPSQYILEFFLISWKYYCKGKLRGSNVYIDMINLVFDVMDGKESQMQTVDIPSDLRYLLESQEETPLHLYYKAQATHSYLSYLNPNCESTKKEIEYYTKCIELYPYFTLAYEKRSDCFYNSNQYAESLKDCEMCEILVPKDMKVAFRKAVCYSKFGRFQEAIDTCTIYINKNLEEAAPYLCRSHHYLRMKDYENAIADIELYEKYRLLEGRVCSSYFPQLAEIYEAMGEYEKALACHESYDTYPYSSSCEKVPSLIKLGRYEEALESAKIYMDHYPSEPLVFSYVGDTYKAMGNIREALSNYDKALNIVKGGPFHGTYHAKRGILFFEMGEIEKATQDYEQSILRANEYDAYEIASEIHHLKRLLYGNEKY